MSSRLMIIIAALLICIIGISSIYSSTCQKEGRLWQDIYKRQILWALIGALFFMLVSNVNYHRIWDWTYILYIATVFFLFLVFILGLARLGAQRWLRVAWFNFQPSEFAKLAVIIFLARYYSRKSSNDTRLCAQRYGIASGIIIPFLFICIPMGLIVEQPDLGSGLMLFALFISMLLLSGVKFRYIFIFLFLTALPVPFLWHFLRDYQKERLLVFLNPNIDPLGAGYTIIQSKIAIGSGGLFGKGWLAGTQSQLRFLPESHTDFIFATFAEQWGFFGGVLLLLMYLAIICQGFNIAQRTSDQFGRLLAAGISLMLSIQICVNIFMNMGLAPVVGLPLPLMSYGGSSMIVTLISIGILVNIDKTRTVF